VRRLHVAFVSCFVGLALQGTAHATLRPFTGTLTISVDDVFVQVVGSGTADVTADAVGSAVSLVAGDFFKITTPFLPNDTFFDSVKLSFTNLAGNFAPGAGLDEGFGGALAFDGKALFDPVDFLLGSPFGGGNVSVPVGGVGRPGGTGAGTLMNALGTLTLSIGGDLWTTGRISPYGYFASYNTSHQYITAAHPMPIVTTATGKDITSGGFRILQLVTPISIRRKVTSPAIPAGSSMNQDFPGYARLDLMIELPEPSRVALNLAAVVALLGVGLWRARRD
jgi:hypothetical protein